MYRLYARAVQPQPPSWEVQKDRGYFAMAKGRSCIDVCWRQAARSELAEGRGEHSALIAEDFTKFYENMCWHRLRECARRHGILPTIVECAIGTYSNLRYIRQGELVAIALHATRSVVAGCSLATSWVTIYYIDPFDLLVARCPAASIHVFVDDTQMEVTGKSEDQVVEDICVVHGFFAEMARDDLGQTLAADKRAILASSWHLQRRLSKALGPPAPPAQAWWHIGH